MPSEYEGKHFSVDGGWLGRTLALLAEFGDDDARAAQLYREAPDAVRGEMVAIRRIDLNDPAHIAQLVRENEQP